MQHRRAFLGRLAAQAAALLVLAAPAPAQQIPLAGSAIVQWVDPLPVPHVIDARGSTSQVVLEMREFQSPVMPTGFVPAAGPYTGTYVWGYRDPGGPAGGTYIGPAILASRGTPTEVKYVNDLGSSRTSRLLAWTTSTDQTLHWADPLGTGHSTALYDGPIPAVAHLHGGEVPPQLDGGPDAWFTSDGAYQGHAFYSKDGPGPKNHAIYRYPNTQEAANLWFHDHVLGATRLNVYAGLAGAYLLSDPALPLPPGLGPYAIGDEPIVPLVIQDRMFDVNGQLYFPNVGINPEHPRWVPEFVGDTIVVNGKVWPTFGTPAAPKPSKRYRFLVLNGSNARTYELFLVDPVTKVMGPPLWVIGTDGGYLDRPVKLDPNAVANGKLVVMPGERYDVVVDLNDPAWRAANPGFSGQLVLRNTGRTPFPRGAPPNGSTVGQILKLFVGAPVADAGYDPDPARGGGAPLRPAMVRLAEPATGTALKPPDLIRQLTLNEAMGAGGPLEVLVNNTRWDGKSVATDIYPGGARADFTLAADGTYYSELPVEGRTELWELVNLTADAHPIHLHLVQFQLLNRQGFNRNRYTKAYDRAFPASAAIDPMTGLPYPGGVYIGGFGPPLDYHTGNARALGGNPDIVPHLQGVAAPPLPQETGWKDTVTVYPGQVTRLMVRWAPTDLPATVPASSPEAAYPFDPNGGHGYVWHCHIIDHEDNEMMRPDTVTPNPAAPAPSARSVVARVDY